MKQITGNSIIALSILWLSSPFVNAQGILSNGPTPVEKGGPFDRVYHPENAPSAGMGAAYPQEWLFAYGNPARYAVATLNGSQPDWFCKGVSWQFAEARAWPLANEPYAGEAIGEASSDTTSTQWMGNAVGVSVVDGVVYAQSDDQFAYAVNARTGKLIWRTSPVPTTWMGQPLVQGEVVDLNAGTVGFNFSNLQAFAKTGVAIRGASVEFNGIYALNRRNGELLWHFDTKGGVMPTPALHEGRLVFSTGAGEIYALDAKSGEKLWLNKVGGMGNMSTPAIEGGKVYVGMAVPAFLFCVDAQTGATLWKGEIPEAINTGMGDVSPAVANGVVVIDAVSSAQTTDGKTTVDTSVRAFDAETGKPLWTHLMGRGPKPPAFKGGVPMIHEGIVYVGTPVNSIYQALDLKTGKLLWTWKVPEPGPAGAGRGPATYYDSTLYISTTGSVFALDPQTGKVLGGKKIGGRFGIVSPTIVGGTMYLGNSWDWIIALPLTSVNPHYVPAAGKLSGEVEEADAAESLSGMSPERKKQEQAYFRQHSFEFSSLFSRHHPGPYWILAHAAALQLSPDQLKQQEELKNGMAADTIAENTVLKKAYETYARDAAVTKPVSDTLQRDIEAIGESQTRLARVMIPYHLKAHAALNPAQQSLYQKLAAQP